MVDRDYRVVYKTRTLDRDEERPRIPTALDPYDNPYSSESSNRRKSSARNSSTQIDDDGSTTEVARSTTRTSYPVRESDRSRDMYVDTRNSTRAQSMATEDVAVRRSVVVDQKRDDYSPRYSESKSENRSSRDRSFIDVDVGRPRGRGREYYLDSSPREAGSPYVIEARQGDIIDVIVPGRNGDARYDKGRQYTHDRDYDRGSYPRSIDEARRGNTVVIDRDYPSGQGRYEYDDYQRQYDREQDRRLADSMKGTRIGSAYAQENYAESQTRSRAPAYPSGDPSVVSSSRQTSRPREYSSTRSAIARTDYPEPELRRRRSRSVSFRGSQVCRHDASECRHERPGAEAEICGHYLRRGLPDYDDDADTYLSYRETDRRSRVDDRDQSTTTYRERDEPYASQLDYNPNKREGSRRRRRDDEQDDASYYSERVTRKTTRESR